VKKMKKKDVEDYVMFMNISFDEAELNAKAELLHHTKPHKYLKIETEHGVLRINIRRIIGITWNGGKYRIALKDRIYIIGLRKGKIFAYDWYGKNVRMI
jgi:hypothetical protein